MLSVLNTAAVSEDALIYDAQKALWDGRAFLMTYVGYENVLADMGQAYDVQVEEGTLSTFVCAWLERQKTVSPDGNPWE